MRGQKVVPVYSITLKTGMTKEDGEGMGIGQDLRIVGMVLTCWLAMHDNVVAQESRVHVPDVTSENGYLVLRKKSNT